jgi:hypothetical protein
MYLVDNVALFDFKRKDWKQYLTVEDETKLNDFIKKVLKYRGAYKNAQDIKSSQLWCAVLELRKENLLLKEKVKEFEDMFEAMFKKMKKRDEEKAKLIKSLEQF